MMEAMNEATVAITGDFQRDVSQAWSYLQAARDAMPEVGIEGWREAYREALPLVTNIRDLADVMRLKLETELGKEVLAKPRAVGGRGKRIEPRDGKDENKSTRMRAYRRTQLAAKEPEVETYTKQALAQGKRVSVNGALRAIGSPATWKPPAERPTVTKPKPKKRAVVRQPTPHTLPPDTALWEVLVRVREEIARRRKENHDHYKKSRWTPDAIKMRAQTELLDWIEEQLALVPGDAQLSVV